MAERGWRRWVFGRPQGVRHTLWAQVTGQFDPDAVLAHARPEPIDVPPTEGAGVDVLDASSLAEGEVAEVLVGGEALVLCRVDGVVHALDAVCPHAGGPLAEGDLDGHELVCPWHGWPFDVRTGACGVHPTHALATYEVWESGGRILVRFHASEAPVD